MPIPNNIHFVHLKPTLTPEEATTIARWALKAKKYQVHVWVENTQLHLSRNIVDLHATKTIQDARGQQFEVAELYTESNDNNFTTQIHDAIITETGHTRNPTPILEEIPLNGYRIGTRSLEAGDVTVHMMPTNVLRDNVVSTSFLHEETNEFFAFNAAENIVALKALHKFGGIFLNISAIPMDYALQLNIEVPHGLLFKTINETPYIFSNGIIACAAGAPELATLGSCLEELYLVPWKNSGEFERTRGGYIQLSDYGEERKIEYGRLQSQLYQLPQINGMRRKERKERIRHENTLKAQAEMLQVRRYAEHGMTKAINNWVVNEWLKFAPRPEEPKHESMYDKFTQSINLAANSIFTSTKRSKMYNSIQHRRSAKLQPVLHPDMFLMHFSFEQASGIYIRFSETKQAIPDAPDAFEDLGFELI